MKRKYLLYSIVIIITVIQCYILINYNKEIDLKDTNINETNNIIEDKKVKYIKEIEEEFSNYKTLTILNYKKIEDGSWKLKCLLKGSKEDVIKDIEKINYYNITDYNLSYEKDNVLLEVDIISK